MMEPLRKTWNPTVTLHASRRLKDLVKIKKNKKRKKKKSKSNFVMFVLEQTTGCLLSWTLIHNRRKKSDAPPTCPGEWGCRAEPSTITHLHRWKARLHLHSPPTALLPPGNHHLCFIRPKSWMFQQRVCVRVC